FDVFMDRVHPNVLIEVATEKAIEYQYEGLAVESQMAQEFIADKLAESLQARGYPAHTRIKQIKQRTRKALRIEALLPDIENGKIRFHERFRNSPALEQFEMYPMHKHDYFPDCIALHTIVPSVTPASVRTVKRMHRQ